MIRFVGKTRARNEGEHSDVSADVAEKLLLGVLVGGARVEHDDLAAAYAQLALLAELVAHLDRAQLDAFLNEAYQHADPGHSLPSC